MTDDTDPTRLLEDAIDLPYDRERFDLLTRAIESASAVGDESLEFTARSELISTAIAMGDRETTMASFAWCLGRRDANPDRYPVGEGGEIDGLLWNYKNVANYMTDHPQFSVEHIEEVLDDLERRYREAGLGMSGVLQVRFMTAISMGRLDHAAELRDAVLVTPRDEYSHCHACVRATQVNFLQRIGDRAGALAMYDGIIEEGLYCMDEPESVESNILLSLLREGRLDDAREAHFRSYRGARENSDGFPMLHNHLEFCAVTGNEARGLSILERHLHLLPHDPLDEERRFRALTSYGVLLNAVSAKGHGELEIHGARDPRVAAALGTPTASTVDAIAESAWREAQVIARSFDDRNDTHRFSRDLDAARALGDEHYDLPLESDVFVPLTLPDEPRPDTAEEWREHAYELAVFENDPSGAIAAAQNGLQTATGATRTSLMSAIVNFHLAQGDKASAEAALDDRLAELRLQTRDAEAAVEARLRLAHFGELDAASSDLVDQEIRAARAETGTPAIVLSVLLMVRSLYFIEDGELDNAILAQREAIDSLADQDEDDLRAQTGMMVHHVSTLLRANRGEDADSVLAELEQRELTTSTRGRVLMLQAQTAAGSGDFARAIVPAEELQRLHRERGLRRGFVDASSLVGQLHSELGDDVRAAFDLQLAVKHAELGALPDQHLRLMLGKYQLWSGRPEVSVETLSDLAELVEQDAAEDMSNAEVCFWLGVAARAADELNLAYHAWGRSQEHAAGEGHPHLAVQSGLERGRLLMGIDSPDAIDELRTALVLADELETPGLAWLVRQALGQARIHQSNDDAGLDDLRAARESAAAAGDQWSVADITDSLGRGLIHLQRSREGVAELLSAADGYAGAGDDVAAAMSEWFVAATLADGETPGDAIEPYRSALVRLPESHPAATPLTIELSDVLESVGRVAEAADLRRTVD